MARGSVARGTALTRRPRSPPPPHPTPPPPPPPPLRSVRFWGRVTGTTADYLVAAGVLSTADFPVRKWFYATSKELVLRQLPGVTAAFAAEAAKLGGARFVGNPSARLGADADAEEEAEELDEEGVAKPRKELFSEAHRLAAAVAAIEADCGVVPKGAFAVTASRHVVPNAAFGGLSASAATALNAWAHFRPPTAPARAAALAKAAAVPGTDDFLDSLDDDEPRGVWATALDAGRAVARVASLRWPGYFAFATVDGTAKWGAVYVGDGRAAEVQWML